ncbi:MAG TPA: hypothetical protein VGN88_12930 [Phycisphaerae bacterium]
MNRFPHILPVTLLALLAISRPLSAADPIINASTEQKLLITKTSDGGIPPLVGVQNFQVFRASRAVPELTDSKGWTYNHHMDLAQWKGHMLLAWTNGEKDEDTWPSHEMLISTEDGVTWTKPAELFPQGVSTSLRTYFFHAPNGHMLTIAGLRTGTEKLDEAKKGGIVIREILPDQSLGPVYTLTDPPAGTKPMMPQPKFDASPDKPFVEACRQLLANHTFLEQQDFGTLLGNDRMAVYKGASGTFGKAMCFFHRADGTLVGLGKNAWTILSTDEGKTWSTPVRPPSVIVGSAKEWAQRLSDNTFSLIYNPAEKDRFPLIIMGSTDGITFNNMRTIHSEVPLQRYEGVSKSIGPQYTRGISEWASDGSHIKGPAAGDQWIVYSEGKEDIWVSRIPVPLKIAETASVHDTFTSPGIFIPNWNTYSPKWATVSVAPAPGGTNALTLEDRDPYDYASAQRIFPESASPTIKFKLFISETPGKGRLEIDLRPSFGPARPVRLAVADGKITATNFGDATIQIAPAPVEKWLDLTLKADAKTNTLSVSVNDATPQSLTLVEPATTFSRIILRTGTFRAVTDAAPATRPAPESDKPADPIRFLFKDLTIQ